MTPLGLVGSGAPDPQVAPAAAGLRLRVEDALASSSRLWVRGRLIGWEPPAGGEPAPGWWGRWRGKVSAPVALPEATLETQVSGSVLRASVPVGEDGRFEALFTAHLPPGKRGWRMARNRLTLGAHQAEGCGIVVAPPAGATGAVVVILPLAASNEPKGPQELANLEPARRLGPLLQRMRDRSGGRLPYYYVAGFSGKAEGREAELALATTALGWPGGSFILVPPAAEGMEAALARAVDRLRWLFAGGLDLRVINLEPAAVNPVAERCREAEDRARVVGLAHAEADWENLVDGPRASAPRTAHLPPRRARAGRVTRHPIVFCHGMLARSALRMELPEDLNYFTPLREFLARRGFRVLFPQVSPTAGVAARAAQLRELILRWTDEPVNLVAHSMGGLDARYLITHLGMADRVRSLTTVSTPHRGTHLADWFIANFRQRVPLLLAMEALGVNVDGFRDCRPAACRAFNAATPDAPQVRYFSYGGATSAGRLSPLLRRGWNILTPVEGPNDGMVSVASARWGEYLGTLHADHYAQTPDAVYLRAGEDFDSLGFFTRLVEDLARRGF